MKYYLFLGVFSEKKHLQKILLIMKLITFFLILATLQSFAKGYGQSSIIKLNNESQTLLSVIESIENQSDYKVFYKTDQVDVNQIVDIDISEASVASVLNKALNGTHLSYVVMDKIIVFAPEETVIQPATVKGTITDATTNEPLIGVNISVEGTNKGVISDKNGKYAIEVQEENATLVFSYIGYAKVKIPVGGKITINITLSPNITNLEEVVVLGYGSVKRNDLTGSVASVNSKELILYPSLDGTQALQGKAAGVVVHSSNGEPGTDYSIRIRGNTSINAMSEALLVVDGLPGASMPVSEDIESIEVLKDASSTAIYGSRGANGVIMITTKSGKSGTFKVDFNTSYSFQKEIKRLEVLNGTEFAEYINEVYPGFYPNPSSYGKGTDWQDELLRPGGLENYQLSISGGKDKITYYLSGTVYDQKGIFTGSDYKRYSLKANVNGKVFDWLDVGTNIFAKQTNLNGVNSQSVPGTTQQKPDFITAAYSFPPTQGIYDSNGDYSVAEIGFRIDNPYALATELDKETETSLFQNNFYADIDLLKNLKFRASLGTLYNHARSGLYYPSTLQRGKFDNGEASLGMAKDIQLISENYLTYTGKIRDNHEITFMGGYSYQSDRQESMGIEGATGFITDAFSFWNLGAATGTPGFSSKLITSKLVSYYGRANYKFKSKYFLTFNARYDGSSNFAKNKKWAFFPSAALAWTVTEEDFLNSLQDISKLKVRASYGITGNQAIEPYQSLATFTTVFATDRGTIVPAIRPATMANNNLTWESTAQSDIGVDFGLFNDRIIMTADYYNKITSGLLFLVPVPAYSGGFSQLQNVGKVQNRGFEYSITSRILNGKLSWSTSANISFNKNTILKLIENNTEGNDIRYSTVPLEGGGGMESQILREGESVGAFYGYIYEGVLQEGETPLTDAEGVGGEKFQDIKKDGILNADDRTIIGNPHPDFTWGWNNNFNYGKFDFNIFIQGSQGGDILNYTLMDLGLLTGRKNSTRDALNRWTPTNTDTDIPAASLSRAFVVSDRFIEDASYVRLKNISIGYSLNAAFLNKIKIQSLRIYISGQNLLTLTKYKGVDPEVSYYEGNTSLGLDYGSYPNTKSLTIGLNVGF
jgi:TonB-dependent starch-binding outer membrane protein SusC